MPPVSTVFFGGGTPTLLPPAEIGAIIAAVSDAFGLLPGAEVTIEANPETVDQRSLASCGSTGSPGCRSACRATVEHVLAVLDRQHTPGRPQRSSQGRAGPASSTSTWT